MRKFATAGLLSLIILLTAGCVREEIDPEKCIQALRIELEWMNILPREDTDSIRIRVMGPDGFNRYLYTDRIGSDVILDVDDYTFIGWEQADNATVRRDTVAVALNSDGTVREPEQFAAGLKNDRVLADETYQIIYLPMWQQTRELEIRLQFIGDGAPLVNRVDGELEGVTVSRLLENCFPPFNRMERVPAIKTGTMKYHFTEEDPYTVSDSRNLIGINGAGTQPLDLRVMFITENYTDFRVDVTDMLDGFHTENVAQPWVITLTLNIGALFTMDIVDWESGPVSILEPK